MSETTAILQRTVLFAEHQAAAARLVDFAGWQMPIHYGSQLDEHQAVRSHAGLFDVSHMLVIDVTGEDAHDWLRQLLANDVARLKQFGKALYSCLLNEDAGILDDLIVYYLGPEHYRLIVNAGRAGQDLAWLQQQAVGHQVMLQPRRDLALLALQGPKARELFAQACADKATGCAALTPFQAQTAGDWLIARTGYTGEDGYEIALPATEAVALWQRLLATGVRPCGLGARDTLRLEAGLNLYGQDMDVSTTPFEAGLMWTVALKTPADPEGARDFIGRAALERHLQAGSSHTLYGLLLETRGVLRAHQALRSALGDGEITSGTFSPTLQQGIALARLPLTVAVGDAVEVDMRGKWLPARVVKPPFVRHGKILVS